jgi:ABC-type nitrate/sulfonate/bicarbonate transport system substrate-binding protein
LTETGLRDSNLSAVEELWFTRCPVPTATGIAADLGWFDEEFDDDGIIVRSLQERHGPFSPEHYGHGIPTLFREGGNVPALWAKAGGQATRLIGLTWIEERQAILVRQDSDITGPDDLYGRRLAIPRHPEVPIDFWSAMALRGFEGALSTVGRTLSDADLVDVAWPARETTGARVPAVSQWHREIDELTQGNVDAIYVKGAVAAELTARGALRVAIDLDAIADRRVRFNNGTPRPITVHQQLLEERPDLVARYLSVVLRAVTWADSHPDERDRIIAEETGAGREGVLAAYGRSAGDGIGVDLSDERLALLVAQKDFLLRYGYLDSDIDIREWADHEPLRAAAELNSIYQAQTRESR